jgi:hypothetical protein
MIKIVDLLRQAQDRRQENLPTGVHTEGMQAGSTFLDTTPRGII